MNQVIEQRIREAAKAHLLGREVTLKVFDGIDCRRLVAVYRASERFARPTMHVVFTGGSSAEFQVLVEESNALFKRMVERTE